MYSAPVVAIKLLFIFTGPTQPRLQADVIVWSVLSLNSECLYDDLDTQCYCSLTRLLQSVAPLVVR